MYKPFFLFLKAHDSAIKCMAMDPHEELFVTGSAEGDIKVNKLNFIDFIKKINSRFGVFHITHSFIRSQANMRKAAFSNKEVKA